ncbi:MAG: winged helix-turn-helix domain-containing protein [Tepidanaerobacteraceae bacterium]|nr:winged helix-turn-helix domain-containing protein [Tepidanaerobacteraceae bacterium]
MTQFKAKKIPLYIQIKEYIRQNIEDEKWPVGSRLPAERDLAQKIGVSRKTISLAYKELENEGLLSSHQGRGTFVIDSPKANEVYIKKFTETIDKCLDTVLEVGIDIDIFLDLCKKRVNKYKDRLHKLKIMLVECNNEQLDYFCKELEFEVGVCITPVLLQDFKKNFNEIQHKLKNFDYLITTLFHIEEVKSFIKNEDINLLPIALNPQIQSIIKIARLPKHCSIGILTISENFAKKVEASILEAGLHFDNIFISTSTKPEEVRLLIKKVDAIIVSPSRKKHVTDYIKNSQNVIEFIFVPDAGSINLLKTSITKK